mmetsp:Transcript_6456/g.13962  ORF Transcript_6456/g.13962 Transcript_6456/m.13962 type:complete len:250 (-) Transcript_6456:110-859(-)
MASSRVGARTSMEGPLRRPSFFPTILRRAGIAKASVLPLPVSAMPTTSRSAIRTGHAALWIGVGVGHFFEAKWDRRAGGRFAEAKLSDGGKKVGSDVMSSPEGERRETEFFLRHDPASFVGPECGDADAEAFLRLASFLARFFSFLARLRAFSASSSPPMSSPSPSLFFLRFFSFFFSGASEAIFPSSAINDDAAMAAKTTSLSSPSVFATAFARAFVFMVLDFSDSKINDAALTMAASSTVFDAPMMM